MVRRRETRALTAFAATVLVLLALPVRRAHAEEPPTLSGFWSASPLTSRWNVAQWEDACGAKPAAASEPGGTVTVTQSGGELTISGNGRTYSTTQCWEQVPGMARAGHSGGTRKWSTNCNLPASGTKQGVVSMTLTATDTSMSFYESGRYTFYNQGKICGLASIARYRTYTLVKRNEPQSAASAAPSAASSSGVADRCANPGPAVKVDVRPPKKLLKAGEEFSFRAVVMDGHGCPLPTKAAWEITDGSERVDVSNGGSVRLKADATEGEVRLTATASGHSSEATIEVVSTDRYNAVLKSGAFNATAETDGGVAVAPAEATRSIGATSAVAEDKASGRKLLFVALIGAIALILAGVGAVLFGRARAKARAQTARYEAQRAEYEALVNSAGAAPPAAAPQPAAPPPQPTGLPPQPMNPAPPVAVPVAAPPSGGQKVCPICGTEYGPQFSFCGQDGGTLLPKA